MPLWSGYQWRHIPTLRMGGASSVLILPKNHFETSQNQTHTALKLFPPNPTPAQTNYWAPSLIQRTLNCLNCLPPPPQTMKSSPPWPLFAYALNIQMNNIMMKYIHRWPHPWHVFCGKRVFILWTERDFLRTSTDPRGDSPANKHVNQQFLLPLFDKMFAEIFDD